MKQIGRVLWIGLLLSMLACASNKEAFKAQGEASRNLGEAYMQGGDYTSALKEFLKAEKLYEEDHLLQYYLGRTYMEKNQLDTAIHHFKLALEQNPSFAPARNALGFAYGAKKDWDAAIATLKELTGDLLYGTPHLPLTNLGGAYYNKGEYETAEQHYLDALKIEPDYVIALKGLGKTYVAMGRGAKAVGVLEKAVTIDPKLAELYFDLGSAHVLAGDTAKALDAFRKFLALEPENPNSDKARHEVLRLQSSTRN